MNKILLIGHDASRTGAPIILLHFLRWLKTKHPHLKIDLLLLSGGVLEEEYNQIANVYVIHSPNLKEYTIFHRVIRYISKQMRRFTAKPFYKSYDLVIGNTNESIKYLAYFKRKGNPTLCWIHELEYAIETRNKLDFLNSIPFVDEFVAGSNAVRDMLIKSFHVDEIKTHLVYEFSTLRANITSDDASSIRKKLNIPHDAFIVGSCGTLGWRKGTDVFLQLAYQIKNKYPDIYFLWVENHKSEPENSQINYDIKHLKLDGRVIFTGEGENPHPYFSAMDIFVLTSREDPFPLVCLEAAQFAIPIICFKNAGGMPEFVEDDAGAVVDYGDINSFVENILRFYNDRKLLNEVGNNALEKLVNNFSLENSCTVLEKILFKFLQ